MKIDLSRVTVLVGENGSGKSSTLKAIHWAVRCATLSDRGKTTLDQMDYVPSKDFLDLGHKLKYQNNREGRKFKISFSDEDSNTTSISISAARNDAGVNVDTAGPAYAELTDTSKPSTAYIPGLAGTAEEETVLALPVLHRKAASGEGGSVLRQILLLQAGKADGTGQRYEYLESLSHWVSQVLPGAKFWVKFDRVRDRFIDVKFLTPDMKIPGQAEHISWKSIDMAGTGFLQIVQIFAYLLYFKPRLLLIDEPDAHLHPGRQQRLIKALEAAAEEFTETQIIVTTHSPSLVRALSSNAQIHWIDQGKVRAHGSTVRERMGWSTLDKDLIIFSEDGNTEKLQSLIDQWPHLSGRCLIWPTFGKDALPYGDKAAKIRDRMAIQVLIHRDADFMSDLDMDAWKIQRQYVSSNIPVWFTFGSDVESYFCDRDYLKAIMDVPVEVIDELLDHALNRLDGAACMDDFSSAYQETVNKLPKIENRNPIHRWNELGGKGFRTVKGKVILKSIESSCVEILPKSGLGRKIGNRNKLGKPAAGVTLASDLKVLIEGILQQK